MMSDAFAQNDSFFYETEERRDPNDNGFYFNAMSMPGTNGFSFGQLGMNNGFSFNDTDDDGLSFNDLDLFSDDVTLGGGMLLLTSAGLMYLQTRRIKKRK